MRKSKWLATVIDWTIFVTSVFQGSVNVTGFEKTRLPHTITNI